MSKTIQGLLAGVMLSGAAGAALAAEGRIPLYAAAAIASPGSYVVTRNISVSSGSVFTIQASDVTIDLNGHLLASSAAAPVISIDAGVSEATIRGGKISGGTQGISGAGAVSGVRIVDLSIRGTSGHGISLVGPGWLEIRGCSIAATAGDAIHVDSALAAWTGTIADNRFHSFAGNGIWTNNFASGAIVDNQLASASQPGGSLAGILLTADIVTGISPGGVRIEGNSIECRSNGSRGIDLRTSSNRIVGNTIGNGGGHGIYFGATGGAFAAQNNVVEGNQISGNGSTGTHKGLYFDAGIGINVWKDNLLRGNSGGATGGPSLGFQVDGGGNN